MTVLLSARYYHPGESPTYVYTLHEVMDPVRGTRSKHHAQIANMSFDCILDPPAEVASFTIILLSFDWFSVRVVTLEIEVYNKATRTVFFKS